MQAYKDIVNSKFKRYSGLCVLQVTTDTLALMLEGGQLRLQIVSRDSDKVSRVGTNLTNGDWLRVALTLGNGRYSMQGVLLCHNTERLKYMRTRVANFGQICLWRATDQHVWLKRSWNSVFAWLNISGFRRDVLFRCWFAMKHFFENIQAKVISVKTIENKWISESKQATPQDKKHTHANESLGGHWTAWHPLFLSRFFFLFVPTVQNILRMRPRSPV